MPKRLIITTTVTCAMTADDWELYDRHGRNDAAIELNTTFETLVNDHKQQCDVERGMLAVMRKHVHLGAMDSEPIWHLERMLAEVFHA